MLAESGTSVAHCRQRSRDTVRRFRISPHIRAGVNMGLGTDVSPHNMLEEMRTAAILARVTAEDIDAVHTSDVLDAATVGGAKACCGTTSGALPQA